VASDYLYRQIHLASPTTLKSLAKKVTSKEKQSKYLQLSETTWTKMFAEQKPAKSYKVLLAEIYLKLNAENSKSSFRKTSAYFAQSCLDDDEIMAMAIALLLKDGKPQKWIIHKVMDYPSNKYNEGRERYYELIGESK